MNTNENLFFLSSNIMQVVIVPTDLQRELKATRKQKCSTTALSESFSQYQASFDTLVNRSAAFSATGGSMPLMTSAGSESFGLKPQVSKNPLPDNS